MDKIFKAFADINRRKILTLLTKGELSVSQILKFLDIGQATLSSHLAILRKANLVSYKVNGRERIYRIEREVMEKFVIELNKFIGLTTKPVVEEIKPRNIR